jgi:hypothetical protein
MGDKMKTKMSKFVNFEYGSDIGSEQEIVAAEKFVLEEMNRYEGAYLDDCGEWDITLLSESIMNEHNYPQALADEVAFVVTEYWGKMQ